MRALWYSPAGHAEEIRLKAGSGPLYDAFMGIRGHRETTDLKNRPEDLAYAYALAVWVYRCIKIRADAVAGVPLELVDGEGQSLPDHPLAAMLRDVNPHTMNRGDLLRATESAYNIWGAAYWLLQRRLRFAPEAGFAPAEPRWIQWLNPQTIEVKGGPAGIAAFEQRIGTEHRTFAPQDVVYFRNFDPFNDVGGLSPLSVALQEVNADLNAVRFVAAFFANDARPGGLLTTDQKMLDTDVERTRNWWQRLFQGTRNKWKVGIVGGGLTWQEIGYPVKDLALAELRQADRMAICAAFGVPAGMAGAMEQVNYATAREQKASLYEDTIIPQLDYYAEVLNFSLVTQYPDLVERRARLRWKLDTIEAIQENTNEAANRVVTLWDADLMTRNEAREAVGLDPLAGVDGESFKSDLTARARAELARIWVTRQPPDDADLQTTLGEEAPALRAALDELDKAERWHLKRRSPGRPFVWERVPADVATRIEQGMAVATTDDARREVFHAARSAVRSASAAMEATVDA